MVTLLIAIANLSSPSAFAASFTVNFNTNMLLTMPWPEAQYHRISGGDTYHCGKHINNDQYAIDFVFNIGDQVASVGPGIAYSGTDSSGYGTIVLIHHTNSDGSFNGMVSLYAHLSQAKVTTGQKINRNQLIALSGNSGGVDAHLHLAVYYNIDPTDNTPRNDYTATGNQAFQPEPMSGYTNFDHYGVSTWGSNPPTCIDHGASPFYAAAPWTSSLGIPQNESQNPYEVVLGSSSHPLTKLHTAWPNPALVGDANSATNNGSPILDNALIYASVGGYDIYGLSPQDGSVQWHANLFQLTGNLFAFTDRAPVVYDGKLYIFAYDGKVHAIDLLNTPPKEIWEQPSGMTFAITKNVVYTGTDSSYTAHAYDAQKGTPIWNKYTSCATLKSIPAVDGNFVFYNCADKAVLFALRTKDGSLPWPNLQAGSTSTSPVAGYSKVCTWRDQVKTGAAYNMACYKESDGTVIWTKQFPGNNISLAPAIANNKLYLGTNQDWTSFQLFSVNVSNGMGSNGASYVWSQTIDGAFNDPIDGNSRMAIANNKIYVSSGHLEVFNQSTGLPVTFASTVSGINSMPVVADGMMFLWSKDNTKNTVSLYCYTA